MTDTTPFYLKFGRKSANTAVVKFFMSTDTIVMNKAFFLQKRSKGPGMKKKSIHFFYVVSWCILWLSTATCSKKAPVQNKRTNIRPDFFSLTPDPIRDCHIIPRKSTNLSLSEGQKISPEKLKILISAVRKMLPNYLQVRVSSEQIRNPTPDSLRSEIDLYVEDQKLCEGSYRVHFRNGEILLDSRLSDINLPDHPPEFKSVDADPDFILSQLSTTKDINFSSKPKIDATPCLSVIGGQWEQGWTFTLTHPKTLTSQGLMTGQTLKYFEPVQYSLSTELQLYDKNHLSGKEKIVSIHNMQNNGFLCSDDFVTRADAKSIPDQGLYIADSMNPEDLYFQALSSFAYASEAVRHLSASGMTPWYLSQVQLWFTDKMTTPSYIPPVGSAQLPTIILPREGDQLKYFRTDSDVVYHEFGHHLVYKSARDITKNSVFAIHDGLADFLAYALNDDPCLAESLCVDAGSGCTSNQCLRTANNSLTLQSLPPIDTLERYEHYQHAELISGLLWDLKTDQQWNRKQSLSFIVQVIEYLDYSADFNNFSDALIFAEDDLFTGTMACKLRNHLKKRGFQVKPSPQSQCNNH